MTDPRRIRNLIQADSVHSSALYSVVGTQAMVGRSWGQLYKYNVLSTEKLNQLGTKSSRIVSVGSLGLCPIVG